MQERLIGGGVVAAIFLPLLFIGGLPFQLLVGAMAMVAVSEMLRMKHLEIFSIEGILSMVAALTVPLSISENELGNNSFACCTASITRESELSTLGLIRSSSVSSQFVRIALIHSPALMQTTSASI